MTTVVSRALRSFASIVCVLSIALVMVSCGSQKTIVNALDEREANEILVFLSSKGIDANKVINTNAAGGGGSQKIVYWDISVSTDRATEAMALLNANGLPRRPGQTLLSIFPGQGLVPTEMEQKIRYQAGLAEQIASVIRKIDGVLDAEVQLSFPEDDPLNPEKKGHVTASVYVKHTGVLDDPNSHLITKIKRLVASSVPALGYDDVTVIPDRARISDIPIDGKGSVTEEPKDYVSIWSIVLAKSSVDRFRIIFFSFSLLVLILILMLIWLMWKLYPILQKTGFKQLFSIHSIDLKEGEAEAPPKEEPVVEKKNGDEESFLKGEEEAEPPESKT